MFTGKSPFFPSLEDQSATLLEDPNAPSQLDGVGVGVSVGVGVGVGVGGGITASQAAPLSSPSRSSPHSQGSETGERFSRKVFVGGLPPDIDEGILVISYRRSSARSLKGTLREEYLQGYICIRK